MSLFRHGWRSTIGAIFLVVEAFRIVSELGIIKAASGALNLWQIYEFSRDHLWNSIRVTSMLDVMNHPAVHALLIASGVGLIIWDNRRTKPSAQSRLLMNDDKLFPPALTQGPASLLFGLYVADIGINLNAVETDHHGELSIRLFNGTGRTLDFISLSGPITFKVPNLISGDPQMKGELPEPTTSSTTVRSAAPYTEWNLVLDQRFPSKEAKKIPVILRAHQLQFDLTLLNIQIAEHDDPKKVDRLDLWKGIRYERGGSGSKSRV
jgi:hypothetical protein